VGNDVKFRVAVGTALAVAVSATLLSAPARAAAPFPDAPTITAVTPTATGTLVVSYTIPASDGGSAITSYQASVDGGANWPTCSDAPGTCTLLNLTNGTAYSVQIRAVNAAGPGVASAAVTGTPVAPAGPDPDKPAVLPKPRVWATARFTAAGNDLGSSVKSTDRLGVGTLPKLTFNRAIPGKAVVERHLTVRTTDTLGRPYVVPGSWGWLDDRTVMFRPKSWWPGNARIDIVSTLGKAVLGKTGSTYVIGSPSLETTYTFFTARRMIIKVDGQTHLMKVYIDGRKVKTFPISLGQKEWETRNGVKVISTRKEPTHTYTSVSLNLTRADDTTNPEFYELKDIPWNTRLTPTGEFMHAAPWALGRLGKWNGSHGCTNMRVEDAKWIYDKTIPGDVSIYTNTGGDVVEPGNGPGGLWNIPWAKWLKKSALRSVTGSVDTSAPAPVAVADGSASA
jgi:lipoprotein-anchoring transpeptidase ErfK/SrfK